jgi:hypothetical protein
MSTDKIAANRLTAVTTATLLILSIVFVSLNINSNSNAFAQGPFRFGPFGENRIYTFGAISSVQDDNNGKPAWILTGFWKTNLINQTTQTSNTNAPAIGGGAVFSTSFRMIMTNGSGMHTHTITDFVLKNKSMPNKTTTVFNGTASASLKEGVVTGIPISVKVMNNSIISIWLDPAKLKNHFGNTPIYGIVFKRNVGAPPPPPNMGAPMR